MSCLSENNNNTRQCPFFFIFFLSTTATDDNLDRTVAGCHPDRSSAQALPAAHSGVCSSALETKELKEARKTTRYFFLSKSTFFFVDAHGAEAVKGNSSGAAVASVVLALANLGCATDVTPPYVVSMSQQGGGGKPSNFSAVLQVNGVAPDSVHVFSASGGSVRATVSDP